jgi:hypothetical protein
MRRLSVSFGIASSNSTMASWSTPTLTALPARGDLAPPAWGDTSWSARGPSRGDSR